MRVGVSDCGQAVCARDLLVGLVFGAADPVADPAEREELELGANGAAASEPSNLYRGKKKDPASGTNAFVAPALSRVPVSPRKFFKLSKLPKFADSLPHLSNTYCLSSLCFHPCHPLFLSSPPQRATWTSRSWVTRRACMPGAPANELWRTRRSPKIMPWFVACLGLGPSSF